MRALGYRPRREPAKPAETKAETEASTTEEPTPAPADQSNSFDESVVIN